LFRLLNRFLPEPGTNNDRAFGQDSQSGWSSSWLTSLSRRAAERNNERPVTEPKEQNQVELVESGQGRSEE
jgi:hypothetical protein